MKIVMIPALYFYNTKLMLYSKISLTAMVKEGLSFNRHSGILPGKVFPVEMGTL